MRAVQEEFFGPVVVVLPFDDEDEAVALANGTEFGLYDYVFTGDTARGMRVARQLRSGNVGINTAQRNHEAPFGGFKQSGVGRDGGSFGLHAYSELQIDRLARLNGNRPPAADGTREPKRVTLRLSASLARSLRRRRRAGVVAGRCAVIFLVVGRRPRARSPDGARRHTDAGQCRRPRRSRPAHRRRPRRQLPRLQHPGRHAQRAGTTVDRSRLVVAGLGCHADAAGVGRLGPHLGARRDPVAGRDWRLYFAGTARRVRRQCIGVATAANPDGPFVPGDQPLVCQLELGGSIDPYPYRDPATGIHYLYWKSDENAVGAPTSRLWGAALSSDGSASERARAAARTATRRGSCPRSSSRR